MKVATGSRTSPFPQAGPVALIRREPALLVVTAALLLFLSYLLSPEDIGPPVELTEFQPPRATLEAAPIPAAQLAPTPATSAPVVAADLILHGVMGAGGRGAAILTSSGGHQRVVQVGREFLPGLRLKEIGLAHAVLTTGGGDIRLDLERSSDDGGSTSAVAAESRGAAAADSHREETIGYRLGMTPRKVGGRTVGFALRPGANLQVLARAGLRPGDILVAVNGQAFESEEKVLELSREIAGSYTAEFEFERDGKRMKSEIEINPRPSA